MRIDGTRDAYSEPKIERADDGAAASFDRELQTQKKKSAPPAPTHHAAAKPEAPKPPTAKGTTPPRAQRRGATGTGVNAAGVDDGNLEAPTTRVPKLTDQVAALVAIPAGMMTTVPATDAPEQLDDTAVIDTTIPPPISDAATPMESAVHDLLRSMTTQQIARLKIEDPLDTQTTQKFAKQQPEAPISLDGAPAPAIKTAAANAVTSPAAVAEVRALPEQTLTPSHVHLVLGPEGDDAQRVVVTVAVRGTAVTTTFRSADESTTAALSRNAASLDDAMRARGLHLSELDAKTDDNGRRRQQQHHQKDDHDE